MNVINPERIHLFIDTEEAQAEALQQGIYELMMPNNSIEIHFYSIDVQLKSFKDDDLDPLKVKEFTIYDYLSNLESDSNLVYESEIRFRRCESAEFPKMLDGPPPNRERAYIKEIHTFILETRRKWDIPNQDFVLLLTPKGNDFNKFSSFRSYPFADGFIQTSDWEYFTNTAIWYPVTYLILEILLKLKGFGGFRKSLSYQHETPKGCFNDKLEFKKDFHQKIRIADICENCLDVMIKNGLSSSLLISISNIFDTIRKQSRFINQHLLTSATSDLIINKEGTLVFQDFESISLRLPPIERTVYMFLIKHLSGVSSVDFTDYKQELSEIYKGFRNQDDETVAQIITKMVDHRENSLQEKVSKINKALKSLLQSENRYASFLIKNQDGKYYISLRKEQIIIN